jgi:hypothetical protein
MMHAHAHKNATIINIIIYYLWKFSEKLSLVAAAAAAAATFLERQIDTGGQQHI